MLTKNLSDNFLLQSTRRTPTIKTVLDLVPCSLIYWKSDRTICFLNQRVKHLTDFKDDQLEENPSLWINRIHPRDRSLYVTAWKKLRGGEKTVTCDYRFSTNGKAKEIWLRDESIPYKTSQGKVEGILSTYTDISDLKARRRRSEKKESEIKVARIIKGTIHEIQNNLQVMRLAIDLSRQDQTEVHDHLDVVSGIEQINKILQQVDEFFIPPELHFSRENLKRILEDVIRHVEKELQPLGIPVRLVCRSPLPVIRLDLVQIRRALEWILGVSRVLLIHGGKLEIEAGLTQIEDERYVELKIASLSDTPFEVEEKDVLQPFLRIHRHQVGLTTILAREIIHRHEGKLFFRKETPQHGVFIVLLKVRSN